jgi:hypothetical protein
MGIFQAGPSYTRLKMSIPVVLLAVAETRGPLNEPVIGVLQGDNIRPIVKGKHVFRYRLSPQTLGLAVILLAILNQVSS